MRPARLRNPRPRSRLRDEGVLTTAMVAALTASACEPPPPVPTTPSKLTVSVRPVETAPSPAADHPLDAFRRAWSTEPQPNHLDLVPTAAGPKEKLSDDVDDYPPAHVPLPVILDWARHHCDSRQSVEYALDGRILGRDKAICYFESWQEQPVLTFRSMSTDPDRQKTTGVSFRRYATTGEGPLVHVLYERSKDGRFSRFELTRKKEGYRWTSRVQRSDGEVSTDESVRPDPPAFLTGGALAGELDWQQRDLKPGASNRHTMYVAPANDTLELGCQLIGVRNLPVGDQSLTLYRERCRSFGPVEIHGEHIGDAHGRHWLAVIEESVWRWELPFAEDD